MATGWISVDRKITKNWLWEEKPFSYGQAWIDLLLMASWKDSKELYRGSLQERKRGQVHCSILFLADRWGWSRNKVRHYVRTLERDGMVTTESTTQGTTITIENYAKYQDVEPTQGTTESTTQGTTGGTTQGTTQGHTITMYNKGYNNLFNKEEQERALEEMRKRIEEVSNEHMARHR